MMIIVLNTKSGGGTALKKWISIYKLLQLNGSTETFIVGRNGSFDKFIMDSVNNGKTDFVIAGGDGSINYFINRCIEIMEPESLKKIKLGAVGIGSSNDFHKPFQQQNLIDNIPYKINFKEIVNRDVGCIHYKCDDKILKKYFLINASIGITAEGNNFFNHPDFILRFLKKISTSAAIAYAVMKNIITYNNFKLNLEVNNESFTTHISNLGILKSPFFTGKLRFQSDPLFNYGMFDVYLYDSLSKVKFLKLFYALSNNKSDDSLNKKFWRTNKIIVSSEKEFVVEFDGEVIKTKCAEFSVIPELIKVCTN